MYVCMCAYILGANGCAYGVHMAVYVFWICPWTSKFSTECLPQSLSILVLEPGCRWMHSSVFEWVWLPVSYRHPFLSASLVLGFWKYAVMPSFYIGPRDSDLDSSTCSASTEPSLQLSLPVFSQVLAWYAPYTLASLWPTVYGTQQFNLLHDFTHSLWIVHMSRSASLLVMAAHSGIHHRFLLEQPNPWDLQTFSSEETCEHQ